jgi:hypothetical protein
MTSLVSQVADRQASLALATLLAVTEILRCVYFVNLFYVRARFQVNLTANQKEDKQDLAYRWNVSGHLNQKLSWRNDLNSRAKKKGILTPDEHWYGQAAVSVVQLLS